MKRIIVTLLIMIIPLVSLCNVSASTFSDALEEIGGGNLSNILDQNSQDSLKNLGIDEKDYNSIINLSFSDFLLNGLCSRASKISRHIRL